ETGRAVCDVLRIIRPMSETPISNSTISTVAETPPHKLSSTLIRSATGMPLNSSISNSECAMEIDVEVTVPTMTHSKGRNTAPTTAHFHHNVTPRPSGGSLRNFSRK